MTYTTLISTTDLAQHLDDPSWVILDCRFDLAAPEWGEQQYLQSHIPNALYAHLERDLSAPHIPGYTGRHPLPPIDELSQTFSRWGISEGVQVVTYDNWPTSGLPVAARPWWLLSWLGHDAVAVLDGGFTAWQAEGRSVQSGNVAHPPCSFVPQMHLELLATASEVERLRLDPAYRLIDSRSADRYRGENETVDPVAGHIPGAISAPYADNNTPDGHFFQMDALRQRFQLLLIGVPPDRAIFYCGSGVTAAWNLLALAHSGLGNGRLYAGSWSDWITDQTRPVAR
jgi:thiosulfate/3-mercaptopyruvate sulfurtransferase